MWEADDKETMKHREKLAKRKGHEEDEEVMMMEYTLFSA